jgi:hypothetical protein
LAVSFAGLGPGPFADSLQQRRIFPLQALDLFNGLVKNPIAGGRAGDNLMFYPDTCRRLCDLVPDPSFEVEQRLQALVWKEAPDIHIAMQTANSVDAAMALHQSHWIRGEIIVDDVPAVLQVHTFG